jgi:hypothetical protein
MDDTSAPRSAHAAREDLHYIRQTLAAAGRISTVPGKGLVAIGVLALATVWFDRSPRWLAGQSATAAESLPQLEIWLALLAASLVIGAWSMRAKARRTGQVFWSPVLRKAMWGYGAAMLLGGVLTLAVLADGHSDLLPEIWLGCYGAGLVAAGGYSVSPVRWMGLCFLGLAAAAALTPPGLGLALLALGFGWVHIAFGAYVAWRYDG